MRSTVAPQTTVPLPPRYPVIFLAQVPIKTGA